MIIVKLMGGLGNQMFQYAAGRRLAHFHRTFLKFDLGWFSNRAVVDTARKYELGAFTIQENFATPQETAKFRENPFCALLRGLTGKATPIRFKNHIYEKHYHFDPDILSLPDNVYLEGYWQSQRYFEDIIDIIKTEFTVRTEPDATNKQMAETIANTESVSLHVRRGDYISNAVTNSYHGVCSLDYYHNAIGEIERNIQQPHFFVFSDDPDWSKKNLSFTKPAIFVDHNGVERPYEDLRLMHLCKHHIIANSSFSWWGAWLCENPQKQVVAPKRWFEDPSSCTRDLLPEGWERI